MSLRGSGNPVLMEDTGWMLLQSSAQEMGGMCRMHAEGTGDQGPWGQGPGLIEEGLWLLEGRKVGRREVGC